MMIKIRYRKPAAAFFAIIFLSGCASIPKDAFKLSPQSLEKRQIQTRQYETTDEMKIIAASAGVLQDLGFTIDESETALGVVVASKDRSAKSAAQITGAILLTTAMAALGSVSTGMIEACDKNQKMKASVVTKLSEDKSKTLTRVTFQRVVWNMRDVVSKVETIGDANMYQGFFEKLSKAVFLEEQKI